MSVIGKIRGKIRERDYYLSSHAEDEMVEDGLGRSDIEQAVLKGHIEQKLTQDARGTRYKIEGAASDGRIVHVVCRFRAEGALVVVTVYALEDNP